MMVEKIAISKSNPGTTAFDKPFNHDALSSSNAALQRENFECLEENLLNSKTNKKNDTMKRKRLLPLMAFRRFGTGSRLFEK